MLKTPQRNGSRFPLILGSDFAFYLRQCHGVTFKLSKQVNDFNTQRAHAKSLQSLRLFVTPWTRAHQTPLSMGFSRQEYWNGLLCPLPGDLPNPAIEPGLPHYTWILYHLSHQGNPRILEQVAYPFSRGSSQARNRTGVSCIAGRFFTS